MFTRIIRVTPDSPDHAINRSRRFHWLAATAIMFSVLAHSPAQGQVATDVLVQLEMLDTTPDDLVRLATTYADALRDWKSAKLSIDTVQTLRPNAVVTNLEVQIAKVNLDASRDKLLILRAITEKQLAAAKSKLEIVKTLEGLGEAGNGEQGRQNYIRVNDEATVRILEKILEMK